MVRVALALLLCLVGHVHASGRDLPNSRDPLGLQRFPHSWIVEYERDTELLAREFIVSRVDKTRRDVRAESKIRTEARQESATYRIPDGTPREEVIEHYVALLGSEPLFSCGGRDCGRSNHWANYIFRQANLYGPDINQFYLAVEQEGQLVGVYIIERGNRRVYAHVLVIDPERPLDGSGIGLVGQLSRKGFAVISGATPLADGRLPPAAERALQTAGAQLSGFPGREVYVVCHIYGALDVDRLLKAAERCSARAADLLATDAGPKLVSFAAGPMLPRSAVRSRIELVVPPRLREE